MLGRLRVLSLVCAWLCASGVLLDVAQVFAWARMFAGYVRTESVVAAVRETVDPAKPCDICRAVRRARESSRRQQPASVADSAPKIVLACEEEEICVWAPAPRAWPRPSVECARSRCDPVPVPPPRGGGAFSRV